MSASRSDGLDLGAVRLFLSVVELGSMSKAAARHRLAQPSATAKLQKLERQVGLSLLDRSRTGSTATPDGMRLVAACDHLLAAATQLIDRAAALGDERARFRIAATRHVAAHRLPEWVAELSPDIVRVDVVELDTLRVVQAIRAGDAPLGFIEGPHDPVGLGSAVVAAEQLVAVVGRPHRWARRRRPVTVQQVATSRLIVHRAGSGTRDVIEDALHPHVSIGSSDHVEVDSLAAARIAAVNGTGVAFLPRCLVGDDLRSGRLIEITIGSLEIVQPVRMIWRGERRPGGVASALVETIGSRSRDSS